MALPPLAIARMGSFFAGGQQVHITGRPSRTVRFSPQAAIEHDPNGLFHIEPAYVQFFVPEGAERRPNLVLMHGGCLTGASWESTPDGRPGWVEHLLRQGFAVHVVDGVERGRAGWCALPDIWPDEPLMRGAEEIWSLYRLGSLEGYATRTPFPGHRHPVHAFDELLKQHVPRWISTIPAATDALIAVLERVGPAVVIAHSSGGLIGLHAACRHPDLIAGFVGLEPSGFPTEPPPPGLADKPFLFVMGDYLAGHPLWRDVAAAQTRFAAALTQAGAHVTDWRLAEMGMTGNSHMLMMDDNSADLAAMVVDWITGKIVSSRAA
ncbi:MAG: alpha/beta fold hydrolase [Acetobacteraceae bacterium]